MKQECKQLIFSITTFVIAAVICFFRGEIFFASLSLTFSFIILALDISIRYMPSKISNEATSNNLNLR